MQILHTHKPHHIDAAFFNFLSLGLIFPFSAEDAVNHSLTNVLVRLILVCPTRESISMPLSPLFIAVSAVLLEFRTPEGLTNNESLGRKRCKSRENQG